MWPMPKVESYLTKAWAAHNPSHRIQIIWCMVIDFMGPIVSYFNKKYILVAGDYVSKWVEAISLSNNESKSFTFFLKKYILTKFGTTWAILSDGGSHFCNRVFGALLDKYRVKHKVATPYHPQTSG